MMFKVGDVCPVGHKNKIVTILGQSDMACVYTTDDNQLRWNYKGDLPSELVPLVARFDVLFANVKNLPPGNRKAHDFELLGKSLFAAMSETSTEAGMKRLDSFDAYLEGSAAKGTGRWENLSPAQATLLGAVISILPSLLAGMAAAYLHFAPIIVDLESELGLDDQVQQRIWASLTTKAGYEKYVYPKYGFGFVAPAAWSIDDFATRFGVADIDIVQRYTDEKGVIGVDLKLIPVQPNYVNDIESEVQNQAGPWRKIDPNLQITDATVAGKFAKKFKFRQETGNRVGDIEVYWIRLVPEVKLQILCFTYVDEPDREEYWREVERIIDSFIIDEAVVEANRNM